MLRVILRYGPLIMLALGMLIGAVGAHDYKLGDIAIIHPWAKPSIGQAKAGAAFVTIFNNGSSDDRLLAAKSDASELVELHAHKMDGGVMRMRPVEAIVVPAGDAAELAPGGNHIMLLNLKSPLVAGETFPVTLVFEKAGEITVEVKVDAEMGGMPSHGKGHSMTE